MFREPFTPLGRTTRDQLRTFDEWRPSAEAAVVPLEACGDSHRVQVVADIDATWGMEPADKGIVRDLILAMVAPDPTGGYSAITAGDSHTCALGVGGTVVCWGGDTHGQLLEPDGQYSAIAAGGRHTCGIRSDDTVECWGDNTERQLDAPAGQYRAVTAGWNHSCAIRSDKTIACWGGYLAAGGVEPTQRLHATSPQGQYSDVAAGLYHTCAIRSDGTIACWGTNTDRQLDAPSGQYRAITAGPEKPSAGRPPPKPSTSIYAHPNKTVLRQPVEPGLAAGVGVHRERLDACSPAAPGHLQCVEDHLCAHVRRDAPAHDEPAERVHDHAHARGAGAASDHGQVGDPQPVRRPRGEVPVDEVAGALRRGIAPGGENPPAAGDPADPR